MAGRVTEFFRLSPPLLPQFRPLPVYFTGGYGFGTRVLDLAKANGTITVEMTTKIDAGATLHPVLNIGKLYFVSSGRGSGGG